MAQEAPQAHAHGRADPIDTSANRARLSIVDATFALFCLIPPLVFGHQLLNSDGDAARHITMGRLMLREGLHARDPFSHTQPLDPVVLTEWGSRILYALVHGWAGLAGVALLAGVVIGAGTALVVLFLRQRGVDPLLAYLTGILVAVLGQVHWLARPHVFTLVGIGCLLFLLEPGERRRPWLFGALFLPWANLHGGFLIGLILIAVYLVATLFEAWWSGERREDWLARARYYAIGLGIAFVASCLTPEGPATYLHIFELLTNSAMTSTTFEFMSPNFHTVYGKIFLSVLGLVIAVIALIPHRPSLPRLMVVLFMLAAALGARRNIPLFGMVVLPLMALHVDASWRSLRLPAFLAGMREAFQAGERVARPGLWVWVPLLAVLVLAGARGSVAGMSLVSNEFDPETFPVDVVAQAQASGVEGTLFNHFVWGGYLIYAWPDMPIFIDGMTDYFDRQILVDYGTIANLRPGWAELLDDYGVTLALVPSRSGLAYQLAREEGWSVIVEDSTAALMRRNAPIPGK